MIAYITTATMNKAWEAAIAQADTIILPNHLWERPKVKGFTIDTPLPKPGQCDLDSGDRGWRCDRNELQDLLPGEKVGMKREGDCG